MLGRLPGLSGSRQGDVGERMLNAVATQSLRQLFSQAGGLEVEIRCSPPSKLLQGTIDSFKMHGHDLVIRREFYTAEMTFETDTVAIDMGALLAGKIRLKQPTQAIAHVVLTEEAINRAFEAELVKPRLSNLENPELTALSGGEPVTFRDVNVTLLPQQRVVVAAVTDLPNRDNVPLCLQATLEVQKRRRLTFTNAEADVASMPESVRPLSKLLSNALLEVLNGMVDLDRFDLDGITLRLNRLETQGQNLVFSGYAQVEHFPGMM
nr:DUF2993 domain-containing protein [Leptolyngbya sp. PCC 6406]